MTGISALIAQHRLVTLVHFLERGNREREVRNEEMGGNRVPSLQNTLL